MTGNPPTCGCLIRAVTVRAQLLTRLTCWGSMNFGANCGLRLNADATPRSVRRYGPHPRKSPTSSDDIGRITAVIAELLAECRVNNVNHLDQVLPALNAQGNAWFATVRELEQTQGTLLRH